MLNRILSLAKLHPDIRFAALATDTPTLVPPSPILVKRLFPITTAQETLKESTHFYHLTTTHIRL